MINSIRLKKQMALIALCQTLAVTIAFASPLLHCEISYGGSTQIVEAGLNENPLTIDATDIAGRFKFKAVMIGKSDVIEYIKLYSYFQDEDKDILIQQASFYPPFHLKAGSVALGPKTSLYAGNLERELQYQCRLQQANHD